MTIEQTVEIPPSRQLFIDVPPEIPFGIAILTLTPVPTIVDIKNEQSCQEEIREKLQKLKGSLGKNAFGALDGLEYQYKVRKEWDD